MNDPAVDFEKKWHNKIVRPKRKFYTTLPDKKYLVKSALYKYDEDLTILAIMAEDYTFGPGSNGHFFTIKILPENLEKAMDDFEIIDE
ncbi:MAG: hypothetical protein JSW11_00385 [Candidatus Heimdallarchaeota archaeon]|nr:MAG: hypothetical protein JSW11_00385 [Candidatus Heimdallarchaeota archaeon]